MSNWANRVVSGKGEYWQEGEADVRRTTYSDSSVSWATSGTVIVPVMSFSSLTSPVCTFSSELWFVGKIETDPRNRVVALHQRE